MTFYEETGQAKPTLAFPLWVPNSWSLLPEFLFWRTQNLNTSLLIRSIFKSIFIELLGCVRPRTGTAKLDIAFPKEWASLQIIAALWSLGNMSASAWTGFQVSGEGPSLLSLMGAVHYFLHPSLFHPETHVLFFETLKTGPLIPQKRSSNQCFIGFGVLLVRILARVIPFLDLDVGLIINNSQMCTGYAALARGPNS